MDNDRHIQSLWIGDSLSPIEVLSISSFLKNGHQFHLYVYQHVDNIPANVIVRDANEIMPYDPAFEVKKGFGKGSKAPFADIFRLKLLERRGGWWVDMDIICLKNLNDLPAGVIASSLEIPEGDCANCNVLSFPAGHSFVAQCLSEWKAIKPEDLYYGMGVDIVKKVSQKYNNIYTQPHDVFNPISYRHARFIFQFPYFILPLINLYKAIKRAEPIELSLKNSYTVHLWNEVIKNSGIDKHSKFGYFSLIQKLKRRYT